MVCFITHFLVLRCTYMVSLYAQWRMEGGGMAGGGLRRDEGRRLGRGRRAAGLPVDGGRAGAAGMVATYDPRRRSDRWRAAGGMSTNNALFCFTRPKHAPACVR